jgi:uncharacterized protein YbaR (Trm112 family)
MQLTIEVKRHRQSVTQGEAEVIVNGKSIVRYGDNKMEKEFICPTCKNQYDTKELYYDREQDQTYCPKCKYDGLIWRTEQYYDNIE